MSMNRIERVMSVVSGDRPDRPPVSFWRHFSRDCWRGDAAVQAHLDHVNTFDLDFLKIMYDLGYPVDGPLRSVEELAKLEPLSGSEGVYGDHLDTIRRLANELHGQRLMCSTVFNAWSTLRNLVKEKDYVSKPDRPVDQDEPTLRLQAFVAQDRAAVGRALAVIGQSLGNFARECIQAGADGVFLSVRDDWVDTPANGANTYRDLVRATDLRILDGASSGRLNMLHVCGRSKRFDDFATYPVHVINWADRASGPSLRDVAATITPVPCGGVDHTITLREGSEADCEAQVRDAAAQAGGRPIIVAPGCTYDPNRVPLGNLHAVRRAVEAL